VGLLGTGAAPVARLDVTFDHLRSTKGVVRVCLTAKPAHFPRCQGDKEAVGLAIPAATGRFTLPALPYGQYAVAIIHDENGNGRLDTFAGIPREGFGFSRDASGRFGPPRFAAASFAVEQEAKAERVTMRYIF
jgi:uncharacterized protein (DUF2141 family)